MTPTSLRTVVALLLLSACPQDENPADDCAAGRRAWYLDADDDGFGDDLAGVSCAAPEGAVAIDGDCDDADSAVHPQAPETCNGVDDDCDRQTDEGVTRPWYNDADGDGFGAGAAQDACSQPPGHVSVAADCDDTDDRRYPGNTELCDGVDNDCDEATVDPITAWCHPDRDDDGHGDPTSSTPTCTPACPAGSVPEDDDCDDGDDRVYAGATEACDGVDNDCDPATHLDEDAPCGAALPPRWSPTLGSTYLYVRQPAGWTRAITACTDRGYTPVAFDSADEVSFLTALAAEVEPATTFWTSTAWGYCAANTWGRVQAPQPAAACEALTVFERARLGGSGEGPVRLVDGVLTDTSDPRSTYPYFCEARP